MEFPEELTEQQFLDTVKVVARRLSSKFRFGYNSIEDIEQQSVIHAYKSLKKWDRVRPLENFLYRCIHNLLYNDKRNQVGRPDKPCLTCPLYDPHCNKSTSQCEDFENKNDCEMYASWVKRNDSKKNIMQPIDIYNVRDEHEENMKTGDHIDELERQELWTIIDKHLDTKLRADYIKLRHNIKIPKQRRLQIERAILDITKEHYDGTD